jgi:hypothetical protein
MIPLLSSCHGPRQNMPCILEHECLPAFVVLKHYAPDKKQAINRMRLCLTLYSMRHELGHITNYSTQQLELHPILLGSAYRKLMPDHIGHLACIKYIIGNKPILKPCRTLPISSYRLQVCCCLELACDSDIDIWLWIMDAYISRICITPMHVFVQWSVRCSLPQVHISHTKF